MGMYGIDAPASHPETIVQPTVNRLTPFLRATVLACAAAMGEAVEAGDKDTTVTRSLDDIRTSVLRNVRELNSNDFTKRHNAGGHLIKHIDEALSIRNPLPESFMKILDPIEEAVPSEQWHRLQATRSSIKRLHLERPGRIDCPVKTNTPVATLLEQQFGMPLLTEDPAISATLAQYCEGYEGQKSGEALKALCEKIGCIPELTIQGIQLKPAEGARIRVNDRLLLVEPPHGDERTSTVFHLPDGGTLVEVTRTNAGRLSIPGASAGWYDMNRFVQPPRMSLPSTDRTFDGHLATTREFLEFDMQHSEPQHVGPLSYRIWDSREWSDGRWRTLLHGEFFEKPIWGWRRIFSEEKWQQLVAIARYRVNEHGGRSKEVVADDLFFKGNKYWLTLWSETEPETISISTYTDIEHRTFELPQ